MLCKRLPGQQEEDELPPVLHLFNSYGLGVLLSKLVQESFAETAGRKVKTYKKKTQKKTFQSKKKSKTNKKIETYIKVELICKNIKTTFNLSCNFPLLLTLRETCQEIKNVVIPVAKIKKVCSA